jgi:hypothetical protein
VSKSQKSRRGDFIGMVLVACQILYTAATLTAQDAPSAKKMLAQTPPMAGIAGTPMGCASTKSSSGPMWMRWPQN